MEEIELIVEDDGVFWYVNEIDKVLDHCYYRMKFVVIVVVIVIIG